MKRPDQKIINTLIFNIISDKQYNSWMQMHWALAVLWELFTKSDKNYYLLSISLIVLYSTYLYSLFSADPYGTLFKRFVNSCQFLRIFCSMHWSKLSRIYFFLADLKFTNISFCLSVIGLDFLHLLWCSILL